MSPFSLAFRRARALGIILAPGPVDAPRLRLLERDLRRRQFHRDAAGFGALAHALEADRAAIEERDTGRAMFLLAIADNRAAYAASLLGDSLRIVSEPRS